jgi:hypothetical protein
MVAKLKSKTGGAALDSVRNGLRRESHPGAEALSG